MKVACLQLSLNRPDLITRCIRQNFYNAEVDADVILIDNGSDKETLNAIRKTYPFSQVIPFPENRGISHALNAGIRAAKDYDAVVTLANDILMPQGWLKAMIDHAQRIPHSGMIGIHCVEQLPPLNELNVHESSAAFGNCMITRNCLETIGVFNEDYDPYGLQDSDYGYRAMKSGLINYYIPGYKAEHIGHDVGQDSDYRRMKDDGLRKGWEVWQKAQKRYEETGNYVIR